MLYIFHVEIILKNRKYKERGVTLPFPYPVTCTKFTTATHLIVLAFSPVTWTSNVLVVLFANTLTSHATVSSANTVLVTVPTKATVLALLSIPPSSLYIADSLSASVLRATTNIENNQVVSFGKTKAFPELSPPPSPSIYMKHKRIHAVLDRIKLR